MVLLFIHINYIHVVMILSCLDTAFSLIVYGACSYFISVCMYSLFASSYFLLNLLCYQLMGLAVYNSIALDIHFPLYCYR